jgi:hypothetical protein
MLGIIAWIRPDGRNALVVVAGSDKLASGDPGKQIDVSLKVGDLVEVPKISEDMSEFSAGLTMVRSEFWPQIVRDIGAIKPNDIQAALASNVIDFSKICRKMPVLSAILSYPLRTAEAAL